MPKETTVNANQHNEMEEVQVMTLAKASEAYVDGDLENAIVLVIPDTGKAAFKPTKPTKDGKESKAVFIVAELGNGFAGEPIALQQTAGDVDSLPLSVKLSVFAQPPNRKAATVDEALNRKPQTETQTDAK